MKHYKIDFFYSFVTSAVRIFIGLIIILMFKSISAYGMDCKRVGSECREKAEWRIIDGYKVHKNCWRYEDILECHYTGKNTCGELLEKGCNQMDSKGCLKEVKGKCVYFNQEYNCQREIELEEDQDVSSQHGSTQDFLQDIECESDIPCMDGSCADTSYKSNDELAESMARISVLKDMKDNFKLKDHDGRYEFFRGSVQRCKIDVVGFRNCCHLKRDKGWGGADLLHLWGCSASENQLREERKANKCHYVGKYCAARDPIFNICLEKKESYCCFQSDLVKTIQVQGRKQLGKVWGESNPEYPDCSGFVEDTEDDETKAGIHELSGLKFDEMDFGEVHHKWRNIDDKPDKKASELKDLQREYSRIQEDFESRTSKRMKGSNPDIKLPEEKSSDRDRSGKFVNRGGF